PRFRSAWQAYRSVEVLLRQSLGLENSPDNLPDTALAPETKGGPRVSLLADQLATQAGSFRVAFGTAGGIVPEGNLFLADAQALENASIDFRREVIAGLNLGQLAYQFRSIDAIWQRLARRTNRIARGRTGPNIQQIGRIGQT